MNLIVVGRCRSADALYLRGGYREPIVVTTPNFYHKNGHYVRPNRVVLKYPNLKKDVDPNVHVKVFNSIVNVNTKTSKEYIITVFNYMLKDTTSN